MELRITVHAKGLQWKGSAAIVVDEPLYLAAFEPLKTCDSGIDAYVTGDLPVSSEGVEVVMRLRKDTVYFLSQAIAKNLYAQMKALDTHNGYKVVEGSE